MSKNLLRKNLRRLKTYQPGKPIEELKRQLNLKKIVKLASNESPFPPSRDIKKAIIQGITSLNRYPDSSGYFLKNKLAQIFGLDCKNIILGNGSDEIIVFSLRAFVEEGEEVIVGYPTFLIYEIQAKAFGFKVVKSRFKDFRYNLQDIKRKITKHTKLVFIANPDNPNGTYLTHKEVEDFLRSIPKNVIVYFDEAYYEFAPQDFPRSLEFLKKGFKVIIARTFSKAYSLAGLRIGYAFGPPELIEGMEKVREPFNVNSLAQRAALSALENRDYFQMRIEYIKKEKEFLYSQFKKRGLQFVESATNFILVNLKKPASPIAKKLLFEGVIVRDMEAWGLKNFIRITVGRHSENIFFLKALDKLL